MSAPESEWHLDKKVPVAIIVTLLAQLVGFGWMFGSMENRLSQLEMRANQTMLLPERVARIEERQIAQQAILERIDRKLGP